MAISRKLVSEKFKDEDRTVPLIDNAELRGRLVVPEDIPVLSELLLDAFGDERFGNLEYMEWFYLKSPFGRMVSGVTWLDGKAINHLGAAPRRLRTVNGFIDLWLVTNIGSRPGLQGKGYFMRLCLAGWMLALEYKAMGIYGVMNDRSVKALRTFGVVTEAELPVKVLLPGPFKPGTWTHHPVTEEFLDSDQFDEILQDTDLPPRRGVRHWWDAETLRWRLRCPLNPYTVHVHEDLVAISARVKVKGVPTAILMKAMIRGARRKKVGVRKTWLSPTAIGAICAHHRTPFALYAGVNADVRVMGVVIPQQYLPSPLHLCFKVDAQAVATDDLRFDTFELLDFDAI